MEKTENIETKTEPKEKPPSFFEKMKMAFVVGDPEKKTGEVIKDSDDLTSDETHENLKKSNVDVQLRTGTERFFSGYANTLATNLMLGAVVAMGTAAAALFGNHVFLGGLATIAAGAALAAVAHTFNQYAYKRNSENNLDVGDYYTKREAELIATAIEKKFCKGDDKDKEARPDFIDAILQTKNAIENPEGTEVTPMEVKHRLADQNSGKATDDKTPSTLQASGQALVISASNAPYKEATVH